MPDIAVCGVDIIDTGHPCDTTALIEGNLQSKVFIGGNPVAVKGDQTVVHNILVGDTCVPHVANIEAGSANVFIAGYRAARVGDAADEGSVATGSSAVSCGAASVS
jgi:uncharacterized Zn-binding protein involved in type VI secretion